MYKNMPSEVTEAEQTNKGLNEGIRRKIERCIELGLGLLMN